MCKVVNKYKEEYDIYIGRGSMWGNPYKIGEDGTREEVIYKFKKLLWNLMKSGSISDDDLLELDGKRLGCFCKPQDCHGDVIVQAVEYVKQRRRLIQMRDK